MVGEIDLDAALWTIPGARMKAGEPHVVHPAQRVVEILREMEGLDVDCCAIRARRTPVLVPYVQERDQTKAVLAKVRSAGTELQPNRVQILVRCNRHPRSVDTQTSVTSTIYI